MILKFSGKLVVLLLLSTKLCAQEVIPTYSDYLTDNLYLLHPSMAGASTINKIRLTARQQWFDVNNAPSLQTLSLNARTSEKIGVGGILFNDQNGNFSRRGIYGTFAYHLRFSRNEQELNQLSFGMSGGLIQHSLDQRSFREFDPIIGMGVQADIYANMDVGMSYYYRNFFAHATAKNILTVKRDLFYSDAVPSNQRKYILSTGYVFTQSWRKLAFEPSIMYQIRELNNEAIVDINSKFYYTLDFGQMWGGISYRRGFDSAEYTSMGVEVRNQNLQYLTPFVGLEFKQFVFAYTYTHQLNSIVLTNNGFHQLTLGYNFGTDRRQNDIYVRGIK